MDAQTMANTSSPFARRQTRLVIVRANGPLFYSVAAASLLETFAPRRAERVLHFFHGDEALCDWIRNEWSPRGAARAEKLREYIEITWPEFDWRAAHDQYRSAIEQKGGSGPHRATAAQDALARCVAAAESALFYRTLARWADDVVLRDMARVMAHEETLAFAYFRSAFERRARVDHVGFAAAWRTALCCVRAARDTGVRLAFEASVAQWGPNTPFPAIDYIEFAKRMKSVIERQARLGFLERVLFRPWERIPEIPVVQPQQVVNKWFRPVLREAV